MAVLVEAFSVIVRRDAVNVCFVGGMSAFLQTFPNQATCHDADLFRVGFMDSADASAYVESLEASGLSFHRDEVTVDLVIVIQDQGPTMASPWLKYKNVEIDGMTLSICWLAGSDPKKIAVPHGWTRDGAQRGRGLAFFPKSAIGDRLAFLRRENGVEVYLDRQTNKELYSGRPQIGGDTSGALQTQIDAAFHESLAIESQGPVGNLAACLMQCDETEEALRIINKAVEIGPHDVINRKIRDLLLKTTAKK